MFKAQLNGEVSRQAIRRGIAQLSDMTEVFNDIGEQMLAATKQRFEDGRAPNGQKWAPKSNATIEHYTRLGYGSLAKLKPLIGHGKTLSQDIIVNHSRHAVVIGSAALYSRVMQEGATKGAFGSDRNGRPLPWGRIPARVWLGLSRQDENDIVAIVEEKIGAALLGKR